MVHTIIIPKPPPVTTGAPYASDSERELLHRQMLSSVSHDLKTPLASIIGALEIFNRMKDQLSEDKKLTLANVALQEAYRLDNYITNILDMARLENNMVSAHPEEAEIGDIICTCLRDMNHRLRGCRVKFKASGVLDVMTDSSLLHRVLCLVLDNAVQYGGSPPIINIRFGKHVSGSGFIEVRDNGSGIPETLRENIFSKYTRFGKEDQKNAGTGLGLPISRAIMRLLGGTITVANYRTGGTLFTLRFPLQG